MLSYHLRRLLLNQRLCRYCLTWHKRSEMKGCLCRSCDALVTRLCNKP